MGSHQALMQGSFNLVLDELPLRDQLFRRELGGDGLDDLLHGGIADPFLVLQSDRLEHLVDAIREQMVVEHDLGRHRLEVLGGAGGPGVRFEDPDIHFDDPFDDRNDEGEALRQDLLLDAMELVEHHAPLTGADDHERREYPQEDEYHGEDGKWAHLLQPRHLAQRVKFFVQSHGAPQPSPAYSLLPSMSSIKGLFRS